MQKGDVVKLKSGGPKMTIIAIRENGVWCSWFLDDHELKEGEFSLESLKKAEA